MLTTVTFKNENNLTHTRKTYQLSGGVGLRRDRRRERRGDLSIGRGQQGEGHRGRGQGLSEVSGGRERVLRDRTWRLGD